MSKLSPALLKGPIQKTRKKYPAARVFGFRGHGEWSGGPTLVVGEEMFLVRACASELGIREAIFEAEEADQPLVVITPLQDMQLGRDVLVRFARRKLLQVDGWDRLRDLFQVKNMDPRLRRFVWLADAIVEGPSDACTPAPNGVLTLEHLWGEFFKRCLGFRNGRPDARDLLEWAAVGEFVPRFLQLEERQRTDVVDWVRDHAGEIGAYLLRFVESGKRSVPLAAGLAAEVIFDPEGVGEQDLRDSAIRLEKYNGEQPMNRVLGERLAQVANDLIRTWEKGAETKQVGEAREVLDRLLQELGIGGEAWRSSQSPLGMEQRVTRFADALSTSLKKSGEQVILSLWDLLAQVEAHALAPESPARLERLRMACRIRQWLEQPGHDPKSFEEAAKLYYQNGGFLDRARVELLGGEGNEALSKAFAALLRKLDASRDSGYKAFAEKLAAWTDSGSGGKGLFRVEELLDRVCVPLARETRVLWVVMDGMSMAVFRQLQKDILSKGQWTELGAEGEGWPKPCVAALPSVTEVSRCSLLCGRLTSRTMDDEEKGFQGHQGLQEVSGAQGPLLFLKRNLLESGGPELSKGLQKEVLSRRKVVGVVINAVDDHLLKGDQIHFPWTVAHVPILERLLHAARETDRVVVLVSDHGHVFDQNSKYKASEPGERYRLDESPLDKMELRIKGSRVQTPTGWMTAPWREGLRYGPKKNGYHGGISPQEMIIPVCVLSPVEEIQGWESLPYVEPDWWSPGRSIPLETVPQPAAPAKAKKKRAEEDLPLFSASPLRSKDWKQALLSSEVLASQRALAGRSSLQDAQLVAFLSVLESHGGTLLMGALAQRLTQPAIRMRGMVTALQRLLNVEGYQVLAYDASSETVSLDLDMLKRQFEIES